METATPSRKRTFGILMALVFTLNLTGCHHHSTYYGHFTNRACLFFVHEALEPNSEVEPFSFTEIEQEREILTANFETCATELGLDVTGLDLFSGCSSGWHGGHGRFRRHRGGRRGGRRCGRSSQIVFEEYFQTLNETLAPEFRKCFQMENGFLSPEETVLTERLEFLANETLSGNEELRGQIVELILSDNCTVGDSFKVLQYLNCVIEPCVI